MLDGVEQIGEGFPEVGYLLGVVEELPDSVVEQRVEEGLSFIQSDDELELLLPAQIFSFSIFVSYTLKLFIAIRILLDFAVSLGEGEKVLHSCFLVDGLQHEPHVVLPDVHFFLVLGRNDRVVGRMHLGVVLAQVKVSLVSEFLPTLHVLNLDVLLPFDFLIQMVLIVQAKDVVEPSLQVFPLQLAHELCPIFEFLQFSLEHDDENVATLWAPFNERKSLFHCGNKVQFF